VRTIITAVDPLMEERGAKLRLMRLVNVKDIEQIIVLCFKKRDSLILENKVKVVYLHLKFWDLFLIIYAVIFLQRPLTNAIYFRKKIYAVISSNDYILVHLVRCLIFNPLGFRRTEVDVCEALSANYEYRSDMLPWFSIKKHLLKYDRTRLRKLELSVANLPTYFINGVDPLIKIMKLPVIVPNKAGIRVQECSLQVQNRLLFIGHVDYEPNIYGLISICEGMHQGEYKLDICGSISAKNKSRLLRYPFVNVLGYVDNLSDLGKNYICGLAFLEGSTGTQNKVFDYLELGIPALVSDDLDGLDEVTAFTYPLDSIANFCKALAHLQDPIWRQMYNRKILGERYGCK